MLLVSRTYQKPHRASMLTANKLWLWW